MTFELSDLGFGPFFQEQLPSTGETSEIPARVAAEHRGAYEVWSALGSGRARVAGRLRQVAENAGGAAHAGKAGETGPAGEVGFPGVGDWVVLRSPPGPEHTTVIERVLPRRTVFTRGAAGREALAQVVAANVDVVFAVTGLDADYNVHRLERYLARIWASGAQPVVVLSKADLCDDLDDRLAEVEDRCIGVPVLATSALHAEGLEAVRGYIGPGRTAALVGSSGAGKSTLVNALLGEERMRTGAVRESDGRGRHVTTHRQLVLLPGGGLLLDTPGMRELQLVDEAGLDTAFGDVAELAEGCRFRDCRHESEPGCAVKAAVDSGELSADRFEHWRKLEREAQAYELRHDEHARRQAERVWGQLADEAALLRKWKGGKP